MTTETKVIGGISILTLLIIVGGIFLFNMKNNAPADPNDFSQYVETGLSLDQQKLARDYNPKVMGQKNENQGTSTAPVTVTEFLDYECPACAANGEALVKQLLAQYGDRITIIRKIYPIHGQGSIDSARLVLASQTVSGEAYQMLHAKFFETQSQWAVLPKNDRADFFKKIIVEAGFDYDAIFAESQNKKYDEQIAQDKKDAEELGVKATPSFVIGNHTKITGGLPINVVSTYIDSN